MMQLSRKWRNAIFSARWRHKLNIMADSVRQLPTSYLLIMLTFALSRTLSELYAILVIFNDTGSDVTPISPPGGVTSQIELQILKGNCRLSICDQCSNFCSITYPFRVIRDFSDFFYETGSDVTPISPPGGVTSQIKWQILNGNCRLPICD